jgi:hypothetical protein
LPLIAAIDEGHTNSSVTSGSPPAVSTDTRTVVAAAMSRTKTSSPPLPSRVTRFDASDTKATYRPPSLTVGS